MVIKKSKARASLYPQKVVTTGEIFGDLIERTAKAKLDSGHRIKFEIGNQYIEVYKDGDRVILRSGPDHYIAVRPCVANMIAVKLVNPNDPSA